MSRSGFLASVWLNLKFNSAIAENCICEKGGSPPAGGDGAKEGICQERIAAKRRLVRFRRFCASPVVVIVVGEEEGNQEMWLASPIRLARHSYTLPSNFSPGGNVGAGRRQEGKIGRNEVRKEADARFTSVNNRNLDVKE